MSQLPGQQRGDSFNTIIRTYHIKLAVKCNFLLSKIITNTVKILKLGTPQTIAIIVLKIEKFDVTLH